jgi:prepilin-type N-terminal cleavage/methylation domain-containing protein
MLSLKRQFGPDRSASLRMPLPRAFTLIEIVIALAVLGVMAAGVYLGFNSINTYAVSSRLYSEAQTAAQNQIDLVLSKEPFDIAAAKISGTFDPCLSKVPAELMTTSELDALAGSAACGVTFPTQAPTATPAKTDAYYPYYPYYRTASGQPLQRQAFIYRDSVTGTILVTGTLTSTVIDTGATMTPFADPSVTATPCPLNTRKANVSVTYNFRGRSYNVAMDTLRTADQ